MASIEGNYVQERKVFLVLLLCAVISYVVYFFLPYVYEFVYDDYILGLLFTSQVEPVFYVSEAISWMLFLFHLLVSVALLFNLIDMGLCRYFYVMSVVVSVIIMTFSGIRAYTGLDLFALTIVNMLDGAVIYMLFLSSLVSSNPNVALEKGKGG